MNVKRWVLASLAAFGITFVLDFIAHGRLLMGLYEQTATVWRPHVESHQMMWLMTLGQLLFGLVFAWMYTKGYESAKPGLGQGLRYGLAIGLLVAIPYMTVWYVVLPIPFALAMRWVASMLANCLCASAAVGVIYRRQ